MQNDDDSGIGKLLPAKNMTLLERLFLLLMMLMLVVIAGMALMFIMRGY